MHEESVTNTNGWSYEKEYQTWIRKTRTLTLARVNALIGLERRMYEIGIVGIESMNYTVKPRYIK